MTATRQNRSTLNRNLSQYHSAHHKSHTDLLEMEPGPRRWKAGILPPEPWYGHEDKPISFNP